MFLSKQKRRPVSIHRNGTRLIPVPGMEEAFSIRTQEEEKPHMCRNIREDPVYLAGKLADQEFAYQDIFANGPIDDILKMFEVWKQSLN